MSIGGLSVPLAQASPWLVAEHIITDKPRVLLSDLTGEAVGENLLRRFVTVPITPAPRFGEQKVLTRAQVLHAMHRALGFVYDQQIKLPARMTVERRGGMSRDTELQHTARLALNARWAATCSDALIVTPRQDRTLPLLPAQNVRFIARSLPDIPLRSRMQVWVDVFEQGLLYQSIPVWFDVVCRKPVAVTAQALPARVPLQAHDFLWQSLDIATIPVPLPNSAVLSQSELRRPLPANVMILSRDLDTVPLIRRHTQVELQVNHRQLQISVPAIALADAKLNDVILAKTMLGVGKHLRARAIARGCLEMVDR
jgi:flagella basal body P-ring formation protein FlgA